jgi:hypothetical protein
MAGFTCSPLHHQHRYAQLGDVVAEVGRQVGTQATAAIGGPATAMCQLA